MDEECPPEQLRLDYLDPKELQKFFAYTLLMCKKQKSAPLFGCEASVFHLDRTNNCSWQRLTKGPVPVHIYFDTLRNCHRILSVDGCKPLINCTIVPSISLVKKTAKFCQWLDPRSKICYGLGFESDEQLSSFVEKFQHIQEFLSSLCASTSTLRPDDPDSTIVDTPSRSSTSASASESADHSKKPPSSCACASQMSSEASTITWQSDLQQCSLESLRYENERLKFALAQSAHNAKRWEQELESLKEKNQRLSQLLQRWIADETRNTNLLADNATNPSLPSSSTTADREAACFQLEKLIAADTELQLQNGEVHELDLEDESELSQKILSVMRRNRELQSRLNGLKPGDQTPGAEHGGDRRKQLYSLHTEVKRKLAEITAVFQTYSDLLESELL